MEFYYYFCCLFFVFPDIVDFGFRATILEQLNLEDCLQAYLCFFAYYAHFRYAHEFCQRVLWFRVWQSYRQQNINHQKIYKNIFLPRSNM